MTGDQSGLVGSYPGGHAAAGSSLYATKTKERGVRSVMAGGRGDAGRRLIDLVYPRNQKHDIKERVAGAKLFMVLVNAKLSPTTTRGQGEIYVALEKSKN